MSDFPALAYVLYVYKSASGQMAGQLVQDGISICGVAGCVDLQDVEEAIDELGYSVFAVIDFHTGEVL